MKPRFLAALLPLFLAVPAFAQNPSAPGALELYPTFSAVGARIGYTGDDNQNATAQLEWRAAGAASWTPGVTMTRITNRRWAGSVLWLASDTPYEVRAVITDPDGGGGTVALATRTRRDPPTTATGRTWWVATTGDDAGAGTTGSPLKTIQAATGHAQPGDEVRVRPGVYYEAVDPPHAGTSASPIFLVADGPGVTLDGADPAYLHRSDWRDDGGGVFSVPYTGTTRLVCADSLQRLYRQADVASLQAGANGIAQGYFFDGSRLYVRLEDNSNPSGHTISVARYDVGIYLNASDWQVRGFEIRHYGTTAAGAGIHIRAANRCVVANNHLHTMGGKGIYLRVLAADNLIENNLCRDPRLGTWPWSGTKGHLEEQQGISHRGGRGNVIRRNTIQGTFDGIDVAGGESDENVGADCDIESNMITGTTDDALEPETISGINVRVVKNRIHDVFSGISIAPNYQGPEYVLYNVFTDYRRGCFKFSLSSVGQTWICHNTATSTVSGAPGVHPSGPYSNVHFRNNILVGNNSAAVSDDAGESDTGNDFDGDLIHSNYAALFRWKNTNYSTITALRSATGFEINGRSGDPQFTAQSSGDLSLRATSPAIDGAIRMPGINDAYAGAAPDMGALERGTSGPDVTPPSAITDLNAR